MRREYGLRVKGQRSGAGGRHADNFECRKRRQRLVQVSSDESYRLFTWSSGLSQRYMSVFFIFLFFFGTSTHSKLSSDITVAKTSVTLSYNLQIFITFTRVNFAYRFFFCITRFNGVLDVIHCKCYRHTMSQIVSFTLVTCLWFTTVLSWNKEMLVVFFMFQNSI